MIGYSDNDIFDFRCDDPEAFEYYFHDWILNRKPLSTHNAWGPQLWREWGMSVIDGHIVFDTPEHRTLFLLRWS